MYLHRYTKNNKKPIWKYKNMHLCKLSLTHFNFLRQPWILYSFSTLQSCLNSSREKSWLFFQLGTLCKNSLRKLSMTHFNFLRPSWILSSFTTILSTQNCSRKKWLFFQCVYEFYLRWLQNSLVNLLMVRLNINTTMTLFVGYSRLRNKRTPLNKRSPWNIWLKQ